MAHGAGARSCPPGLAGQVGVISRERDRSPRRRVPGSDRASAASRGGDAENPKGRELSSWPAFVADNTGLRGIPLPSKPLIVHSAFTGLGSHAKVLDELCIPFIDAFSCDPKGSAVDWMRENHCLATHHYATLRQVIDGQGDCATCGGHCDSRRRDTRSVDLFFAGFCCQPYSKQARSGKTPQEHPLWYTTTETIEYVQRLKPRAFILENTLGFLVIREYEEGKPATSGYKWLKGCLPEYVVQCMELDLKRWVSISRPRVWIVGIRRDVGTQAAANAVRGLATDVEEARAEQVPDRVERYMFQK